MARGGQERAPTRPEAGRAERAAEPATGEAAGHRKAGQSPGERSARFSPRPQRRVTTTSRYSLGTTTELLEGLNKGGSAAKALCTGPYQVRNTSMKWAAER